MRHPLAALIVLSTMLPVDAADWPHWRGPTRNDISAEPSGWDGKSWLRGELWQVSVGEGSSSPVVAGDRVYLTGWSNNRDTVVCLDLNSGMERWRQTYSSPRYGRHAVGDQSLYSGACSTPEYDVTTGLLFTLGVDGDLHAWDTKREGKRVWSLNLYERYQAQRRPEVAVRRKTQRDYGYMSSPLVIGEQLIVEVGSKSGNLVAFDRQTGAELWQSENRDEAGHTGGPVPMVVQNVPCVAVLTLRNLVVTRIDGSRAGRTIAVYPWTTDFANNIATPAVSGDSVIITSSYNHGAMCRLRVTLQGATQIWENKMASGVCSPLVHDGRVYWAWKGVHCVDFESGEKLWSGGRVGSQGSCILTADDRLIVYANKGDLSLVETARRSPQQYTQLAAESVLSRTDAWPHVVLVQGRLICRDRDGRVRCIGVSPKLASKTTSTAANNSPATSRPTIPAASDGSRKPLRAVTLDDDWPGTRDALVLAWDRSFPNGDVRTGIPGIRNIRLQSREQAAVAGDGALQLNGGAFLLPEGERPLTAACQLSKQLSIETVITSKRSLQTGPARIMSFSSDGYSRNFTLGQEGDQLILRLRTTQTGNNGMKPEVRLGQILPNVRTHVVVSYRPGQLDCWINGQQAVSTDRIQGDFSNWDSSHHLLLGDEWDGGTVRKWHGRIDRFSVYARGMTAGEVRQRYQLANAAVK